MRTFLSLGEYRTCPTCGQRGYSTVHTCPPRFEARYSHDEDSDFVAVYAVDSQAAAAAFHERRFSDMDYATEVDVVVRDSQRRRATFHVHVEAVPEFSAEQMGKLGDPEPDPDEAEELEDEEVQQEH